jgi:hypothetical protein
MTMTIGLVTFDSTAPRPLADWWALQLGGKVEADYDGEYIVVDWGAGPKLGFQLVPDPTPGKNRIHLDLMCTDRPAEVRRLLEAGATEVAEHLTEGFSWTVLADPDGNQFCVAAEG